MILKYILYQYLNESSLDKIFNIRSEYMKYNKMLFNNELPNNIQFGWFSSSRTSGKVEAKSKRNSVEVESLKLSDFYEQSYDDLINLLLHEMIHVKLLSQNIIQDFGGQHGIRFRHYVDEINKKGFNIPLSDDVHNKKIADKNKLIKDVGVVIISKDSKYSIMVVPVDKIHDETYRKKLRDMIVKSMKLEYIISNNPNLLKYPKSIKKNNFYFIDKKFYSDLMRTKKKIYVE